jgi:ABC-type molybdate transport system substrate-binding protein
LPPLSTTNSPSSFLNSPRWGCGSNSSTVSEGRHSLTARSVTTKGIIVFVAALAIWPVAASAQVKVLMSGGFSGAYQQLLPEFERTSGIKVTTGSGSSQGSGPQTIGAQLASGVPADVVILSREGLAELIAANRIAAGTDVDLARVPLGVAVRAGTPKPDVSTSATICKPSSIVAPTSRLLSWRQCEQRR